MFADVPQPATIMILPQLFLADLPSEAVLTPQLIRDACIAVKRNRANWLAQRRTQELVELVAFAAERWMQPDSGFRRIALEQGAADTGFSPATLGRGLDALFRQLTPENLQALLMQDLGDARRLDEFAAPATELRQGRMAFARGPEMLVHIAAGNLPNSALFSLVLGILTRSAQFMKLPRSGNLIPRLFAHSLADLEPKLGSCLELAVWPGGQESLEAALFHEADCVTAQGSDETLRSIAPRLRHGCRWIPHGHRLSFGFIGSDQLSSYQAPRLAHRAAADITAWNQLGCLSPHVFYVEDRGSVSAEGFAEFLAAALAEREAAEPRGPLPVEIAAEIAGRRSLHELRQAHHRITREEAKTVPRGAFFDSVADRVSDTMLLGGVAWYLADTHGGLLPLLPMAVLGASLIISYERAKAEALGFNAKGGVMERAERVILLGLGLLFPVLLIPVLWIMLVLTIVTAVQRFVKVWRQASQERAVVAPTRRASRRRAARANRAGSSQWRQNLQARRRR